VVAHAITAVERKQDEAQVSVEVVEMLESTNTV
jgi:hypothetical protein